MIRSILTAAILIIMFTTLAIGQNKPAGLLVNLIAHTEQSQTLIHSKSPLFSWIVPGKDNATKQVAYRLIIADSFIKAQSGEGNVWNSGNKNVDSSIAVSCNGLVLNPATQYFWRVKTKTNTAGESEWSDVKALKQQMN